MEGFDLQCEVFVDAPPTKVFDYWTDEKKMQQWFAPPAHDCEVRFEPRVGGKLFVNMIDKNGPCHHNGVVKEFDRPRKLVFTWVSVNTQNRETIVTVTFTPEKGGTMVRLRHDGLPTQQLADMHNKGWSEILNKSRSVVEGK